MNTTKFQSFIQIFEEDVTDEGENIHFVYDEDLNLNIVLLENGKKVPIVELFSLASTNTQTREQKETSDEDPHSQVSTQTVTNTFKETIDEDYPTYSLGTKTATSVVKEQTDTDDLINSGYSKICSTDTATKASKEITDTDDSFLK